MLESDLRRGASLAAAVAALAGALAAPMTAGAAESHMQVQLRLTSPKPNTPTGAVLNLTRPDEADGKPKTETRGVFRLPAGTVINQDAVPPCTKDDLTWQVEGTAACPDSYLGNGYVTLVSGLGPPVDPFDVDQHWYYAPGELVALYTKHGTTYPILEVGHAQIDGATISADLDLPPGYPPGTKTSPKDTDLTIQPYVGPRGTFITTPPTCPSSGKWITTVTLSYEDGTDETVSDAMPCERPG
jgi:hypothetical protein